MAEMKNQKLLNKALNLLPDLVETKVDAVQTVELYKNDNSIVIEQAVDYRKRVLKKGNRKMEKAIRAGSVLLGSKRNSSMWMWFLPSCACQGDMRSGM